MRYFPEYESPSLIAVSTPVESALRSIRPDNLSRFLFREPVSSIARFTSQHAHLVATIQSQNVEVVDVAKLRLSDQSLDVIRRSPNMFFTRDSALCLSQGGVTLRMATHERTQEPTVMESVYSHLGIPITARVPVGVAVEGGDIIFVKEDLLFVGYGPRTSLAGVEYLRKLLVSESGDAMDVLAVRVSPERINLDGVLMPLSPTLLIADMSALDDGGILYRGDSRERVGIEAFLRTRGMDVLTITRAEGLMLATNLIHLGGTKVIAYEHNYRTNRELERSGFTVLSVGGDELVKGSGGPRCMTNVIRYPAARVSLCAQDVYPAAERIL